MSSGPGEDLQRYSGVEVSQLKPPVFSNLRASDMIDADSKDIGGCDLETDEKGAVPACV
jgi:hypothetical protein